jgi:hypothetical protein
MKNTALLFLFLQLADFVTTVIALQLGGAEVNPIVRHFMSGNPLEGLLVAKVLALAIGMGCLFSNKLRAMQVANLAFSGIVAWNVAILARLW